MLFVAIGIAFVILANLPGSSSGEQETTNPTTDTARSSNNSPRSTSYVDSYGGQPSVYSRIASTTDCAALQEQFNIAGDNNDRAEPGTDAHRWSLGYMKAADDRMEAVGCYD